MPAMTMPPAPQWVWLDGRFLRPEDAVVSVFDRSFLLGDGLFEGIRVYGGNLFRWEEHLVRLTRGAEFLRIRLPMDVASLRRAAEELVARHGWQEAFLRLHLSRGVGPRGYSTRGADRPCLVMTLHPMAVQAGTPVRWKLITSSVRLPARDVVGTHKTASKLPQIVARMEAEAAGADEALLLDTDDNIAECASSNIFWVQGEVVATPTLSTGALAGVTRHIVLELCERLRWPCVELRAGLREIQNSDGVFVTVSSLGIVPVTHLDRRPLPTSRRIAELQEAFRAATQAVTLPPDRSDASATPVRPRRATPQGRSRTRRASR